MKKFDAIESLRGWMALWVIAAHLIQLTSIYNWLPGPLGALLNSGDLAVQVFMIVSGFVITHLMISRDEPYRPYIARRFFRLMPLFLFMIAAAACLRHLYLVSAIHNPWMSHGEMIADRLHAENRLWPLYLGLHLTMLHGLPPDTLLRYSSQTFLGPAWSISLEWQFYLVAPWVIGALRRPGRAWLGILLLALAGLSLSGLLGAWSKPSFLPLALPFFFAGISCRLFIDPVHSAWLAIAFTVAALLDYYYWSGVNLFDLVPWVIWAVFFGFTLRENARSAIGGRLVSAITWLLALNPVARSIGRVSYSLYLCHLPILYSVVAIGILLRGGAGQPSQTFVFALALLGVVIAIGCAFLLFRLIELPGIALGSRWAKRLPVDRLAAA